VLQPAPRMIGGGKYRILRPLGEGGMATVFEAENTVTLKRAAIKWLHPRYRELPDASKRLIYEARAAARVRHRNVVDIYDVVEEENSVFLVMELLLGESLGNFLARERVQVRDVIALLLPAMRGLAAAHAVGVVHRDIKPDNIFLAREDGNLKPVPKVIDFGISRIAEAGGARLTRSGVTMGTPRYVSFEQLRGARDVDARADVYAFGVILYEIIVGRPPYDASSLGQQAISFVTTAPPDPKRIRPNVPDALDALVLAAIAREREQRLATIEELIAGLEPFAFPDAYGGRALPAYAPNAQSVETGPSEWAGTTLPRDTPVSGERAVDEGQASTAELLLSRQAVRSAGVSRGKIATVVAVLALLALISWLPASARRVTNAPAHAPVGEKAAMQHSEAAQFSTESVPLESLSEPRKPAPGASDVVVPPAPSAARNRSAREAGSDLRRKANHAPLRREFESAAATPSTDVRTPESDSAATPVAAPISSAGAETLHRAATMQRSQF
jgi:eukaryotic-like serine/threonine-protein kinase